MDESISFLKVGPDVSFGVIGSERELGIDGDAMQFGTSLYDHDVANILLLLHLAIWICNRGYAMECGVLYKSSIY